MIIPFLKRDIEMESSLITAFQTVLNSNQFILGEQVKSFELNFSSYLGVNFTVGVASGLDAIKLSFMALKLKKGDEVILAANAYFACFLAITSLDGIPVPIAPCSKSLNMDVSKLESAITFKTKFILAVHMFGQACEMDEIMRIATKHNLEVVEDFSQAHGAAYNGKKLGTFGKINACSFYPSKNLGALGDGGAITTDDIKLKNLISSLRNYGSTERNKFEFEGLNSRLDEIQAGFLNEKLPKLDQQNERRQEIANKYGAILSQFKSVDIPSYSKDSVYHQYVIRLEKRNKLKEYFASKGIETLIHYPIPAHKQNAFKSFQFSENTYPITDKIAKTCLSLPISPFLSNQEIEYICFHLNYFMNAK